MEMIINILPAVEISVLFNSCNENDNLSLWHHRHTCFIQTLIRKNDIGLFDQADNIKHYLTSLRPLSLIYEKLDFNF